MRQLAIVLGACGGLFGLAAEARAAKNEIKGIHICCKQCVKEIMAVLAKVPGVADVKIDEQAKTVTFTGKEFITGGRAFLRLQEAGFMGKLTTDGRPITPTDRKIAGGNTKKEEVTLMDVHVCCDDCKKIIAGLFKDSKVSFDGDGPQRSVRVTGKGLTINEVLRILENAGFTGNP
jgi:copper chaperone CopZ